MANRGNISGTIKRMGGKERLHAMQDTNPTGDRGGAKQLFLSKMPEGAARVEEDRPAKNKKSSNHESRCAASEPGESDGGWAESQER